MIPTQRTFTRRLLRATLWLLIPVWLVILSGCKTRVVVIPSDKAAIRLPADSPYTPSIPGYFVPDARMLEILTELNRKVESLPK